MKETIYTKGHGTHTASRGAFAGIRGDLRQKYILRELQPRSCDTILEIGSNDGYLLAAVQPLCASYTGIDINDAFLKTRNRSGILFMNAERLAFEDNAFSKIFSAHTFEHIPDITAALKEVSRVLKPDGRFVMMCPWELFRGQSAIKDSIHVYGHPFHCRELHRHRLTPGVIRRLTADLPLTVIKAGLVLAPFPDFMIVMEKCTDKT